MARLNWKVIVCLVILTISPELSGANTIRISPVNYGTIKSHGTSLESTNSSNLPYQNGISLNDYGGYQAILEIDVSSIISAPYYYLELSPWSAYAGVSITEYASIFQYDGNGLVTLDDYNVGEAVGTVQLALPGSEWYTPNSIGGYLGDSYFNITDLMANANSNNQNFLGINIRTSDPNLTGILFRQPVILASDTQLNISTVPEPASIWLFGSALIMLAVARCRVTFLNKTHKA